ncbi:GntR family transcriptional regulator [Tropicibacter naphthalenivorans]|uniref:Transcriptional regulator NanR n=1 Tax=Tropicibacter naphthalenivorans TaxID=441103 RepID=A0A0P1GCI0_9RHOB|nr:GntR family transcriptional regulator [Tropicibacter naphthalenivorans]CUH79074.1 transcriptional regulator NanR [Tropicibacter naphthalenivorans]SMD03626.1 transcriptional regulator, GntR family [Tropicibacter naphthalenivorans]
MLTKDRKAAARADLTARILCNDLAPGAELDETRLAADYALSRTPMRELFQALAGEGLVVLNPNRGARVAPLGVEQLHDFLQMAPLILATAARLAAEARSPDQLAEMRAALDTLAGAADHEATMAGHRFFRLLGEMAGNAYLMPSFNRLVMDHTRLTQGFFAPSSKKEKKQVKRMITQKEAVLAALAAQEPDNAVAEILSLCELSREHITASLSPNPVPIDVA